MAGRGPSRRALFRHDLARPCGEAEGRPGKGLPVNGQPPGESGRGGQGNRTQIDRQRDIDRRALGDFRGLADGELTPHLDRLRAVGGFHEDRLPVSVFQEELPVVRCLRFVPVDVDLEGNG